MIVSNCAIYRGGMCKACGYEPEEKERRAQGLEFTGSELREYKPERKKNKTNEQIFVSAMYQCMYLKGTFRMVLAVCFKDAEKQGTRFRVPKEFQIGGNFFRPIPYGDMDQSRRVSDTYPVLVGLDDPSMNKYLVR